jgi:hypothetical protein
MHNLTLQLAVCLRTSASLYHYMYPWKLGMCSAHNFHKECYMTGGGGHRPF